MIEIDLVSDGRPSRELLTFERMVRVKPYPGRCPYDGVELFEVEQPLQLQPPPTRAEADALRKLYSRNFPPRPDALLEVVSDGQSQLPRRPAARRTVQLHLCEESLTLGQRVNGRLEHKILPALQVSADAATDEQVLCYSLPFSESTFDAIVCNGGVAYTPAPLQLFQELSRVLSPGGQLTVSFRAPRATEVKLGEDITAPLTDTVGHCDARFASKAWLQAPDAADLLYMVGSFYYYGGSWKSIQVEEVGTPTDKLATYAMTATKLSSAPRPALAPHASSSPPAQL